MPLSNRTLNNPERLQQAAERLARWYVRNGVDFLREEAPPGWERNMFSMDEAGHVWYRGHSGDDKEPPLALAFTNCARLANRFGYVTIAMVAARFRLSAKQLRTCGFMASGIVTNAVLDEAWSHAMFTYARPPTNIHRHPTWIDRQIADSKTWAWLFRRSWNERIRGLIRRFQTA